PQEGFQDIEIQGNSIDIGNFIESYFNSPSKIIGVSGYRKDVPSCSDNTSTTQAACEAASEVWSNKPECCEPGTDGCWKAEQTNFRLDSLGIPPNLYVNNYITDPDFTAGDLSLSPITGVTNGDGLVTSAESLFGQYSYRIVSTGADSYTTPHTGENSVIANITEGETWTLSAYCKTLPGVIESTIQMFIFGLDSGYSFATDTDFGAATITCTDEWSRHSFTYTFKSDNTRYLSFRLDGGNAVGITTYWDGLQLEKGNTPSAFNKQASNITGDLTISGKILNSPLALCNDDKFLVDSVRGFGSDEYDSIFVIYGSKGDANFGHPSYGDAGPSGYYYPILNEYDGWRTDPVIIYPGNIGEDVTTTLVLKIKRYFHNIYTGDVVDLAVPTITINVSGINPPHIHFLNYFDEEKPQIGVQSELALSNQPTLQYYNNDGVDLIGETYLNPATYTYATTDDEFGVKAVGSIDFSTYEEIAGQQPRGQLIVNGTTIISNEFSAYTETVEGTETYIWDNIIAAVNNFSNGDYTAKLSNLSDDNRDSNLKTVIIEAKKTGDEYNGVLDWTIDNSVVDFMQSLPTFNHLVHGTAYPILHAYEDFGTIDLLIAASDMDKFSNLSAQVISSDEAITVQNITAADGTNTYINSTGVSYSEVFSWNTYTYPFTGYILDYSSETTLSDTDSSTGYTHDTLSHTNQKIRLTSTQDFNGEVDIAIRITDEDSSYDSVIFKLIVHPVNDPPIILPTSDTKMYMHNINYPNDINIEFKTLDVEEGEEKLSLIEADIVDGESTEVGSYCYQVSQSVAFINNFNAPAFIDGKQVVPDDLIGSATIDNGASSTQSCNDFTYCSTTCYQSFGMNKQ
ncbi:MAG: hypothetical protein H8D94_00025, partial [Candidatus Pelagibacter sp.]|nr:hypothetical protein [Candidatus Pelagibacter sp.]